MINLRIISALSFILALTLLSSCTRTAENEPSLYGELPLTFLFSDCEDGWTPPESSDGDGDYASDGFFGPDSVFGTNDDGKCYDRIETNYEVFTLDGDPVEKDGVHFLLPISDEATVFRFKIEVPATEEAEATTHFLNIAYNGVPFKIVQGDICFDMENFNVVDSSYPDYRLKEFLLGSQEVQILLN